MSGETGRSISNADMRKIQRIISQETGNSISNADKKMVQALIGSGGEMMKNLPKKLFNKAKKNKKPTPFQYGGAVSRGCGAAVSGKKFSGVR